MKAVIIFANSLSALKSHTTDLNLPDVVITELKMSVVVSPPFKSSELLTVQQALLFNKDITELVNGKLMIIVQAVSQ